MRTPHGHAVAYNAQTAVDAKHKLIVAFDLTNEGNDQQQLHPMAVQGKAAVGADQGDGGRRHRLFERRAWRALRAGRDHRHRAAAETSIRTASNTSAASKFTYDAASDSWRCPAGATLSLYKTSHTQNKKEYTTKACGGCPLKPQCTKAARRVIVRDFYEDAREAMHRRAIADPRVDEAPPGNRRTPVWNDEMADGPSPVPGARTDKSQSRTGPGRAELQSQASHHYPRRASAAGAA